MYHFCCVILSNTCIQTAEHYKCSMYLTTDHARTDFALNITPDYTGAELTWGILLVEKCRIVQIDQMHLGCKHGNKLRDRDKYNHPSQWWVKRLRNIIDENVRSMSEWDPWDCTQSHWPRRTDKIPEWIDRNSKYEGLSTMTDHELLFTSTVGT